MKDGEEEEETETQPGGQRMKEDATFLKVGIRVEKNLQIWFQHLQEIISDEGNKYQTNDKSG